MMRVKNNSSSGHVNAHVIQVAVMATLAALGYGSETPNVTTPEFNETALRDYEIWVMSLCVEVGAYICVVMVYIYDFLQNFVALTDLQLRELGELKLGFVMTSILFVFLIVMMVWKLLLRGRLLQQDLDDNIRDNAYAIFIHNLDESTMQPLEVKVQYYLIFVVLTYLLEKFMPKFAKDTVKITRDREKKFGTMASLGMR